jgi:hypothetical protein
METFLSICLGLGLSAACGFRVFVPLLVISIAAISGHLHLSPGFEWLASYPALVALSVATVLEIAGYYVPWVDHLLDTIATPAALIAGTIVSASVLTDMSPLLQWTLAAIIGGGAAGVVQATTVVTRGASTATTGGLGNPIVATLELAGATALSIFAMVAPVLAVVLFATLASVLVWKLIRRVRSTTPAPMNAGLS